MKVKPKKTAERIRARLSLEDQLIQLTEECGELSAAVLKLAEECGELSAAVLKLVRIRRGASPTPMTEIEALDRNGEEMSGVREWP